jgi:hypothetical protein
LFFDDGHPKLLRPLRNHYETVSVVKLSTWAKVTVNIKNKNKIKILYDAQSKQSPIGRKFAQYGHPDYVGR